MACPRRYSAKTGGLKQGADVEMFSPEQLPVKTELVNEFGCALPLCVLAAVHCTSLLGQPAAHDKEATPLVAATHSRSPPVSPRSPSGGKMRHRPQQQDRPPEIGNSGSRPNLAVELTELPMVLLLSAGSSISTSPRRPPQARPITSSLRALRAAARQATRCTRPVAARPRPTHSRRSTTTCASTTSRSPCATSLT